MRSFSIFTIATIFSLSPFVVLASNDIPANSLQVEYKQHAEKSNDLLSLDTVYQIPATTYQFLDEIFTSFYNQLTFNTTIADSTFEKNAQYELIAIPLVAENSQGFNLELFGNFTDPNTQKLSNISQDQMLYNYLSNTEVLDIYNSSMSIGAGISFYTSEKSKVKLIISNDEMPGYGNSNALVGFETSF